MVTSDIILLHNVTYAAVGSEIHLICEDGQTQEGIISRATCGDNGTWLPDLTIGAEHRCTMKHGDQSGKFAVI